MGLTSQQLDHLRNADQRFSAHIAVFDEFVPTVTAPTMDDDGTLLAPKPIPRCTPRYAMAAVGETIPLYGRDAYNRGISYVGDANVSFANTGGAGSLVDNGDGTADWTAPGSGSGVNEIRMTATNVNGSKVASIFIQFPETTYDEIVAEIATVSASVGKHGWKMTFRAKGDVSALTIGKCILLHVSDTWGTTSTTFGGYKYAEGQMVGYISDTQYFEGQGGETWLGVEVSSPWDWLLARTKVGETYWGKTLGGGRFYLSDFAPVDAIWQFVNEITDFTSRHDAILWLDQNTIDDFVIDESDLATIIADVMARTVSVAYIDRYGALYCVPDPDVRADEFWGSPTSTFAGAESLNEEVVSDYKINIRPEQRVKKLTLEAVDNSKLGIWAINEMATGVGDVRTIKGLICDTPGNLSNWAGDVRAQMNRPWDVDVGLYLNHVVDIANFVDVVFTAPQQTNGHTASGQTWVEAINYRPDVGGGGWNGGWKLLKRTEGDSNGSSTFGGSGVGAANASAPATNPGFGDGEGGGWDTVPDSPSAGSSLLASWFTPVVEQTPIITGYENIVSGRIYHQYLSGTAIYWAPGSLATADAQFFDIGGTWQRAPENKVNGPFIGADGGGDNAATATSLENSGTTHAYMFVYTATATGKFTTTIGLLDSQTSGVDGAEGGFFNELWVLN